MKVILLLDLGIGLILLQRRKTFHGGLDIVAPKGTDVISSADGEVIFVGRKGGYGKLIVVKHIMGYETRYGHFGQNGC